MTWDASRSSEPDASDIEKTSAPYSLSKIVITGKTLTGIAVTSDGPGMEPFTVPQRPTSEPEAGRGQSPRPLLNLPGVKVELARKDKP